MPLTAAEAAAGAPFAEAEGAVMLAGAAAVTGADAADADIMVAAVMDTMTAAGATATAALARGLVRSGFAHNP